MPSVSTRFTVAAIALGLLAGVLDTPVAAQIGAGVSLPPGRGETTVSAAAVPGVQSAWVKSHQSSARLISGAYPVAPGQPRRLLAGVELRLSEGWKTYWRHPGDDGGLPPTFDWSASRNLKSANVLYPAPQRLKSVTGSSIGYKDGVVFPVEIEAVDPAHPIELALLLEYGICREICVPAEVYLKLLIEPSRAAIPAALAKALINVPRPADKTESLSGPPALATATATLAGASPALIFDVVTAAGAEHLDLFVEPPAGVHLPMPQRVGAMKGGIQRFRIDLKGVEDAAKLAGKPLRLTITGSGGGTEHSWVVR